MKKHKLRVKFIPKHDSIYFFIGNKYVVQKRYLGFIWITKKIFKFTNNMEKQFVKKEAIHYMNNYCSILYREKIEKINNKIYKQEYYEEVNRETIYKTCECEKRIKNEFNNNKNK